MKIYSLIVFSVICHLGFAQKQKAYDAIYSGIPWFDDNGKIVSDHGACIVKEGGRYYLFGEKHSDTSNAFAGFNCYSSADLYNWKFESIALPVQDTGKLNATSVGERVKVMKCPQTGEFIMYMHADSLDYKHQFVGYATAKNITGPYTFKGALLFNGKPIRKWDMGSFQDTDGSGYVLAHGGEIYKLSNDYKSVTEQVNKSLTAGFEAPTLFRKGNRYYFIGSDLTSWEKNDNYYFTATALNGPWTRQGFVCPKGTLTWNSQCTFVLPVAGSKDTTYLFMGDRWSYPKQASAATYVWQPIQFSDSTISIPQYREGWKINTATGEKRSSAINKKEIDHTDKQAVIYSGNWTDTASLKRSDEKGASVSVKFTGTQISWYGLAASNGGYSLVAIKNKKEETVLSAIVDMYCLYPVSTLKFLSPVLPKGNYSLVITVMGEHPKWSDKRRSDYGSTGYFVSIDKFVVSE